MGIFDRIFNINPHKKTPDTFSEEKTTFEPRPASEIMQNQEQGKMEENPNLRENLESAEK